MEVIQLQVSIGSAAAADALIAELLERRLVACGQRLGPIRSQYRWRGALEDAEEWLVLLKTTAHAAAAAIEAVLELHEAEVPEVLSLRAEGATGYLEWVHREVEAPSGR